MRKLGISLSAIAEMNGEASGTCATPKLALQPHHDHIIDLAHELLLEGLQPSKKARYDGIRFNGWCQRRGRDFYNFLTDAKTPGGHKVIRFPPVLFCNSCNPKDGNGKTKLHPSEVRWYSMTTQQLGDVAERPAQWKVHYENDKLALRE